MSEICIGELCDWCPINELTPDMQQSALGHLNWAINDKPVHWVDHPHRHSEHPDESVGPLEAAAVADRCGMNMLLRRCGRYAVRVIEIDTT